MTREGALVTARHILHVVSALCRPVNGIAKRTLRHKSRRLWSGIALMRGLCTSGLRGIVSNSTGSAPTVGHVIYNIYCRQAGERDSPVQARLSFRFAECPGARVLVCDRRAAASMRRFLGRSRKHDADAVFGTPAVVCWSQGPVDLQSTAP